MRYLRCTQKLLKEIGVKNHPDNEASGKKTGLGDWYVNLLRINRRKCLLFTNENTLFSFLVPKVLKKNILNIRNEFLVNLVYNLRYEGITNDAISFVENEYSNIGIAKTKSKSVLGSMNDMAYQVLSILSDPRLEQEPELGDVNCQLNRIPFSAIGYKYPIELLKEKISQDNSISRFH